jgi:hypothetical protein|tara:strand:- start:1749 stop:2288 length:540 start_codon:yes stop_codon:yes gene_type:complete
MSLNEIFKDEIMLITSIEVRKLIEQCEVLDYRHFNSAPASTSGRYHPKCSQGQKGLIRHTKLAIWWGLELHSRLLHPYPEMKNDMICALIIHDLFKPLNTHGLLLAKKLSHLWPRTIRTVRIIEAVRWHMGRWTPGCYKGKSNDIKILCTLVHDADFCASRRVDRKMEELLNENLSPMS